MFVADGLTRLFDLWLLFARKCIAEELARGTRCRSHRIHDISDPAYEAFGECWLIEEPRSSKSGVVRSQRHKSAPHTLQDL